jgi:hypothetical protein
VKRPRIYGSETNCRRAIARYIKSGAELLDQATGVQKRMDDVPDVGNPAYRRSLIEDEWATRFRKWFNTARPGMGQYLQDQFETVLPVLFYGLPPETGKPRHHIGLDNGVPWLKHALDELRELQTALGGPTTRRVATPTQTASAPEKTRLINHPWIVTLVGGLILGVLFLVITLLLT